jgi:hypothetical protein
MAVSPPIPGFPLMAAFPHYLVVLSIWGMSSFLLRERTAPSPTAPLPTSLWEEEALGEREARILHPGLGSRFLM